MGFTKIYLAYADAIINSDFRLTFNSKAFFPYELIQYPKYCVTI